MTTIIHLLKLLFMRPVKIKIAIESYLSRGSFCSLKTKKAAGENRRRMLALTVGNF
jgi:hypothetical protein